MTIREFAALCSVSPATASRFFTGRPVSPETRARLEAVQAQTGYEPAEGYRSRRRASRLLAAVVPDFRHAYYADMLHHLTECCAERGLQLAVIPSNPQTPLENVRLLDVLAPAGVILFSEQAEDPVLAAIEQRGWPAVVCGAQALSRRFSAVHIDDLRAAYDGMEYLLGLGHTAIGLLSDEMASLSSGFQRVAGCRKAAGDHGLTLPEEAVVPVGTTFADGYAGMGTLLEQAPGLTAVFAFSDDMAAGAIARILDAGLRVPEDLSVLGFDDNSASAQIRPRLTTVHQPMERIARETVELLTARKAGQPSSRTLECGLTLRESCRALESSTKSC